MNKSVVAMVSIFICITAKAETLKVIKAKGNRALVQVVKGKPLANGQVLTIGKGAGGSGDDFEEEMNGGAAGGGNSGPRTHYVGLIGGFSSVKAGSAKSATNTINLSVEYGWNPGDQLEYGFLGSLTSVSGGGGSGTTTLAAGGRFDYDFAPNKAPLESLFSVGATAAYGRASSSGTSTNVMTLFPMVSWKYFILKTPTAVRVDGGMRMVRTSGSGSSATTDTNPAIQVGLFTYF